MENYSNYLATTSTTAGQTGLSNKIIPPDFFANQSLTMQKHRKFLFLGMIKSTEYRIGNWLMEKINNRVGVVQCSYRHFEVMAKNETKDIYPVVLKAELLHKCGFVENEKYALLPSAHEFILTVPVKGNGKNEILAYVKNNGECFARAMLDGAAASNPVYHLHQLQNLYHALTGEELVVNLTK